MPQIYPDIALVECATPAELHHSRCHNRCSAIKSNKSHESNMAHANHHAVLEKQLSQFSPIKPSKKSINRMRAIEFVDETHGTSDLEQEEETETLDKYEARLLELTNAREQLKNDVLAAAQNNLNSYMEMKAMRGELVRCMIEPLKMRRRIGRKLRQSAKRNLSEQEQVLDSHLTQLKLLVNHNYAESQLDYEMFKAGDEFAGYEDFLTTFIAHRKEYHMNKAKAKRLSSDLELLHEMQKFCREYPH